MSVSDQGVNRNPTQLLRYLGLSGPDAPAHLQEPIQGVVPLLPWWLYASEQFLQGIATPGAGVIGGQYPVALVVPANQRWVVTSLSCITATLAAAHTYRLQMSVIYNTNFQVALGVPQSAAALEQCHVDGFSGRGRDSWLLLSPGDQVGIVVLNNVGAAPAVITVAVRFSSFAV